MGVGPVGRSARRDSANAEPGVAAMLVVNKQLVFAHRGHIDDLATSFRAHPDALLVVGTEAYRLAVLEVDAVLGPSVLRGQRQERAVVEDVAVLVDLDERGAPVGGGPAQHFGQVLVFDIDRAGDEGSLGPERDRHRVEGMSSEPNGVDLVTFPCSDVGEYWPLVSP